MYEFNELVSQLMSSGLSRAAAVRTAATRNPDAHREFLLETNIGRGVDHLIDEKFEDAAE